MKLKNEIKYYNPMLPLQTSTSTPSFTGRNPVETITHCNIGMAMDGIIGKVKVLSKSGKEAYLNVMKITGASGQETYQIKDSIGRIIGEMDIKFDKVQNCVDIDNPATASHVFVDFLRNYSNPNTKYHKRGLDEYKHIGTRLLQIAQRRSDETGCFGNIKLHSKDGSIKLYEKLGFLPEPMEHGVNKTRMYLPPEAKEPLSKLYGGL